MITAGLLLILFSVLVLLLIDRILKDLDLKKDVAHLEGLLEERDTLIHQQRTSNTALLAKAAPLLEKTDWMTGRWAGQFSTLVSLENTRNEHVQRLRSVFFDHPDFKASVNAAPVSFIPEPMLGVL